MEQGIQTVSVSKMCGRQAFPANPASLPESLPRRPLLENLYNRPGCRFLALEHRFVEQAPMFSNVQFREGNLALVLKNLGHLGEYLREVSKQTTES